MRISRAPIISRKVESEEPANSPAVNDNLHRFGVAGLVGKNRANSPGKLFIAKRLRERGASRKRDGSAPNP